jgi:hypothetical protein
VANISLPNNWSPREYQLPLWNALASGVKRAIVVWHRRSGKDAVMLHHNACAAFERVGNYWYLMPEYSQCRKALWDAVNPHTGIKRIDEAFPRELRKRTLEQEMKIEFINGSTFQLVGSDNYDSLVGSTPAGVSYSEYAISNPSSWGFIRPILLENNGWALFNTTPRGKNHAYRMFNMATKSPDWFAQQLTAEETGVFDAFQLANELDEYVEENGEEYGKALYLQEYFCSFDAALPGSIWGDALTKLESEGRLMEVAHTEGYPVHSGWDLGKDDDTAIWFYQVVDGELKVIDYYAKNFKDPDYFADYLRDHGKEQGWRMGTHWLPHDAKHDRQGMYGRTILTQFMDFALQIELEDNYDIGEFRIVPSISKQNGIQAGRQMLKLAYFDKKNCENGFDNLKAYHRKYDKEKNKFSDDADHDGSSHAADAWRYVALTWKESKKTQKVLSSHQQLIDGNIIGMTFGDMTKQHFKNKKREDNSLWK